MKIPSEILEILSHYEIVGSGDQNGIKTDRITLAQALIAYFERLLPEKDSRTNTIAFGHDEDCTPTDFKYVYEYAMGWNAAIDTIKQRLEK